MTSPGLPLVLVPGLLCSARLFAEQLPALAEIGQTTVADTTRDDSMEDFAQRILAGAPPRFALAGLSMGGYIAFEIVRRAPERVAKLALLDTSARADTPTQILRREALVALAEERGLSAVVDELFPLFVAPARNDDAALHALVDQMAAEIGTAAFARQEVAIARRPDSRPTLRAIACPTLVLVGDADLATPPELSTEIADGISGAQRVTVPACGHLSTLERPAAVTAALVAWLGTT
jgi:pimeloyl-ACP methyl ester carboxylesterase